MRRIAIVATVLAAGAVGGVLALGRDISLPRIAPTAPIVARASFDPPAPAFGDRMLATIVIALDRSAVRPETVRFTEDVAPLTQLGAAVTSRVVHANLELVSVVLPVACISAPCVAQFGVTRLALPLVRASVSARDGKTESVSSPWPPLGIRGRVLNSDLAAAQPPFQADTAPGRPTYRIAPATLATALDVLAALCAVAAVALAAWQAIVVARRRRLLSVGDPLERALRLAREAETHPPPDRRRALELLARALGRDQRSRTASELAWSEPKPEPEELEELVSEIERRGPA